MEATKPRKRILTPEQRARRNEATKRWCEAHPEAQRAAARRWREANREQVRALRRAHYARHSERLRAEKRAHNAPISQERAEKEMTRRASKPDYMRNYWMVRNHGMTLSDYENMCAERGGLCDICKTKPTGVRHAGRLAVDHNHQTHKTRGLLCAPCNTAIGLLREDPLLFAAAVEYLRKHGST